MGLSLCAEEKAGITMRRRMFLKWFLDSRYCLMYLEKLLLECDKSNASLFHLVGTGKLMEGAFWHYQGRVLLVLNPHSGPAKLKSDFPVIELDSMKLALGPVGGRE